MKIYTKSGDQGKTSLFSGERVTKSNHRIEAYGEVDELNAAIGAVAAAVPDKHAALIKEIQHAQSDLLHVGAWLSTVPNSPLLSDLKPIGAENCGFLESAIDRMEAELPPITEFLLPGGHLSAAMAHIARTVCRRAERNVVRLAEEIADQGSPHRLQDVLVYLNRLSDYLFVLARYCNQIIGVADTRWEK